MRHNEVSVQEIKGGFICEYFQAYDETDETGTRRIRTLERQAFNNIHEVGTFLQLHFLEERWNSPVKT